ncbi:MAG: hypothetical protein HYZ28_08945 [Myxococcales bacterium]|nr:hypothetical protein [Myxococcales bacterium]
MRIRFAAAIAVVCAGATAARAEEVPEGAAALPAPALASDGLYLGFGVPLDAPLAPVMFSQSSANSAFNLTLATPLSIGFRFGRNLLSLGLSGFQFGTSSGSASQSLLLITVAPKYRRYLAPLRAGGLAPFVQGEVAYMLYSVGQSSSSMPAVFGLVGKGGAEHLFTSNFGLGGAAGLRYVNLSAGSSGVSSFAVTGELTANLHF